MIHSFILPLPYFVTQAFISLYKVSLSPSSLRSDLYISLILLFVIIVVLCILIDLRTYLSADGVVKRWLTLEPSEVRLQLG